MQKIRFKFEAPPLACLEGWVVRTVWVNVPVLGAARNEVRWVDSPGHIFPTAFPATFPVDHFAPDIEFSRFCGLGLVSSVFQLII
ncbi:hypothetical protein Bca4012_103337 [Brassica carinata]